MQMNVSIALFVWKFGPCASRYAFSESHASHFNELLATPGGPLRGINAVYNGLCDSLLECCCINYMMRGPIAGGSKPQSVCMRLTLEKYCCSDPAALRPVSSRGVAHSAQVEVAAGSHDRRFRVQKWMNMFTFDP